MDHMNELAAQQQERKAGGFEKRADKMAKKHLRGGRRGRKAEARATAASRKAEQMREFRADRDQRKQTREEKKQTKQKILVVDPMNPSKLIAVHPSELHADPSANATPDPTRPIEATPVEPEVPPAQWAADPHGQHRLRWWNGEQWTNDVAD